MTKSVIRTAVIVASCAVLFAAPASAETINADGKNEMSVKVDDAMLATPRGVMRLRETMQRTARRACQVDTQSAGAALRAKACFAELNEAGNRAITLRAEQWAARNEQGKSLALVQKADK